MNVYLGCGKHRLLEFIHVDRHPFEGVDVVCDLPRQALPFADSSVDFVYTQDFMEHLPAEDGIPVLNEIWRVLKPGALMEHYIPNAGSRNDFGSPSHLSHWNLQVFEHLDVESYRWEKDREYEGFVGGFHKELAELVNFQTEEDGIVRAQSIHVKYSAVKPI
jgi:SAM-dependent methyltransferase